MDSIVYGSLVVRITVIVPGYCGDPRAKHLTLATIHCSSADASSKRKEWETMNDPALARQCLFTFEAKMDVYG